MLVNAAEKARPAFLMLVDIVVVGSSSYFTDAVYPAGRVDQKGGHMPGLRYQGLSAAALRTYRIQIATDDDAQPIHTSSKSLFCVVFMHIAT